MNKFLRFKNILYQLSKISSIRHYKSSSSKFYYIEILTGLTNSSLTIGSYVNEETCLSEFNKIQEWIGTEKKVHTVLKGDYNE